VREPREIAAGIIANVETVIVGKPQEVRLSVIGLLCQGHILIEDVPGVGKTMLARSIARSTGCTFKRIQFTPDTLPSDITGVSIYNQRTGDFEFRPGPIMSQIVLADEINRATPKTQSALLEAMEERQVTVDGVTRPVPQPFLVMATENPVEYEGTFPLPEAQLDRFLLRVHLGYPAHGDEVTIIEQQQRAHPITALEQVTDADEITTVQDAVKEIYVDSLVKHYVVALAESTREHEAVHLGASPRGSLALFRAGQARALVDGRDFVLPDDVKEIAYAALGHRILLNAAARVKGVTASEVVSDCLDRVPIPSARSRSGSR
jgi:MoxR-like ATPase